MQHQVIFVEDDPPGVRGSNDAAWRSVSALRLSHFRPEGSGHRPHAELKLIATPRALHGLFRVKDRFVRCVHSNFLDPVHQDSCVEFFFQPNAGTGYFNFEFNCGGALLAGYVLDHRRDQGKLRHVIPLSYHDARLVRISHSMPERVDPEIPDDTEWLLTFAIPFSVIARYAGPLPPLEGARWRANVFKCGDQTSHPHWASWAPLHSRNFHLPECFGTLVFL